MSKEKKVGKGSYISLMFFTLGSRILGLVRTIIQAQFIGAGMLGEAPK